MSTSEFNPLWVEAAKAGDQSAISALYKYSYRNVYLTIKSMLKTDEDTLLDLLQDSFLKAFHSLDQLSDPNSFNAWVKTIARNQTRDWLKKSKPVLFSALASEDNDAPELSFEDDDVYNLPDVVVDRKETSRLINEILGTLSDSQRMAIGLFYYQDMSVNQVAEEMGVKPGTVKALLNQGRQRVRAKVEALEKQGTKLYSLSPMGFLLWLLRNWGEGDTPNQSIQKFLLQQCAQPVATGATQGTGTLSGAKAAAAASAASHTAALKIVSLVAAVVLLGGAAVGGAIYLSRPADTVSHAVTGVEENAPQAPDLEERPETDPGEDTALDADGERGGTPISPTDRDTGTGNRGGNTGETAQLEDTADQGTEVTPLVNPMEDTGEMEEPAVPPEDTGETEEPAVPPEDTGETEEPTVPPEDTGETEEPTVPPEDTGETEEPTVPPEDTGETEEPTVPPEEGGETEEPTVPPEDTTPDEEMGVSWSLSDDGVLTISGTGAMDDYSSTGSAPWFGQADQIRSVVVEAGVTGIGDYAFADCTNLASVTLPEGLTRIGQWAFSGCSSLNNVELPDTLTEIGQFAFRGCSSQTGISIPEGVTVLNDGVFSACAGLTSVSLPSTLTSIGNYTFYGCSGLQNLEIPERVSSIGVFAFWTCSGLTGISIPEGVTEISYGAFFNCTSLTSVSLPSSLTAIQESAFDGCSALTGITLPDGVSIGVKGFRSCTSLTEIVIPNGVTDICDYAFESCSALNEVHFVGDLPNLGEDLFLNITPVIYYPADNATWTEEALSTYFSGFTVIAE